MFKIGNSKELPAIPEHLSEDGKDFVRQCLQRDPLKRPKAEHLLEHPFVKNATPLEKPLQSSDPPAVVTNGVKSLVHYLLTFLSYFYVHAIGISFYIIGLLHLYCLLSCVLL